MVYKPNKLEPQAVGPYSIKKVHANGTLTIQLGPGVVERISLRRVKPYHQLERFYPACKVPLLNIL
jgi:hypothetical protein